MGLQTDQVRVGYNHQRWNQMKLPKWHKGISRCHTVKSWSSKKPIERVGSFLPTHLSSIYRHTKLNCMMFGDTNMVTIRKRGKRSRTFNLGNQRRPKRCLFTSSPLPSHFSSQSPPLLCFDWVLTSSPAGDLPASDFLMLCFRSLHFIYSLQNFFFL